MPDIIDVEKLAATYFADVSSKLRQLNKSSSENIVPTLAIVRTGKVKYEDIALVDHLEQAKEFGFDIRLITLNGTSHNDVENVIEELSDDYSIDGIVLQVGMEETKNMQEIFENITPCKDVAGVTSANVANVLEGKSTNSVLPCVPSSCMQIIHQFTGNPSYLKGKRALVLMKCKTFGNQMAALLVQNQCITTIYQPSTDDVQEMCGQADVLIVNVQNANFIKGHGFYVFLL
ncbi:unnamed protein product [Gongylonema pulchrum]|uniref:THF_DHG_CYH domain-containing protein n=1 Tax=Gongylonema pulchrum TaxID=637853 RepID=A0A183CXQ2_9BILA|nr:unnamed protein product [Gongylonema pulchrum]